MRLSFGIFINFQPNKEDKDWGIYSSKYYFLITAEIKYFK